MALKGACPAAVVAVSVTQRPPNTRQGQIWGEEPGKEVVAGVVVLAENQLLLLANLQAVRANTLNSLPINKQFSTARSVYALQVYRR